MNKKELKAAATRVAEAISEHGHFSSKFNVPFTAVDLVEATDDSDSRGRNWRVDIIKVGLSMNGFFYGEELLSQSASVFEGVQVFSNHDREQLERTGERDINKIIGWISDVSYSSESKSLQGNLHLLPSADAISKNLVEAWDAGKRDLMGLSIFASANATPDTMEGRDIQRVVQFLDGNSVDIVWEPSAGGGFREILESVQEEIKMGKIEEAAAKEAATKKAAEEKAALEGASVLTIEAATKMAQDAATAAVKETKETLMTEIRDLRAAHAADNVKNLLDRTISESKLPKTVTDKIRGSLGEEYTDEQIKESFEIAESIWSDALAERTPMKVEVTEDQADKWRKSFDRMMLGHDLYDPEKDKDLVDAKAFQSLGHAFRVIEGVTDHSVDPHEVLHKSTQYRNKNKGENWVTESLSYSSTPSGRTQWGEIMGDSITRAMIRAYEIPELHQWRPLVSDFSSVTDFRTQRRIRMGGYGVLPTVTEASAYGALTTPTDEETTYAIEKRGGTEKLTFESIATDDLGTVMRIPRMLGRAAAYTLRNYVFDFLQHGFANTVAVSTTTAAVAATTSSKDVAVPNAGAIGVRKGDVILTGSNNVGTVASIAEAGVSNTVITLVANAARAVALNGALSITRTNTALQTGYDSTDIYHASHRNLASTALSHSALRDAVVAMRSQVAYGESELTLSTRPKYLVVPNELEDIAYKLLASSVSFGANSASFQDENRTTPNIFASSRYAIELIVVDYWLDPNNWFMSADPRMIPTIELGFFQGRQEPELFVQDSPVSDIYFNSDEIQYKIRHIYNGTVLDHRGMYAAKVTNP